MSFSGFLKRADVKEKLKPLRPKSPRKIPAPLQVKPKTNRYSLIGAAFDYLLRFELQHLAPQAIIEPWVAEQVPDLIWTETSPGVSASRVGNAGWWDADSNRYLPHSEVAKRARDIVKRAKMDHSEYLKLINPKQADRENLAALAVRLAKLDAVKGASARETNELADKLESIHREFAASGIAYNPIRLDPRFDVAEPEDVADVLSLLAIVPFDKLLDDRVLFLTGRKGRSSSRLNSGS